MRGFPVRCRYGCAAPQGEYCISCVVENFDVDFLCPLAFLRGNYRINLAYL